MAELQSTSLLSDDAANSSPQTTEGMSIGQYLIRRLQDYGIHDVFGVNTRQDIDRPAIQANASEGRIDGAQRVGRGFSRVAVEATVSHEEGTTCGRAVA